MSDRDQYWMGLALELASRGRGFVEPNPMVGCVIVEGGELIASGFHRFFGGPHAEVDAFSKCDLDRIPNATVYVTLEPCSHFGKTPPCTELFLRHPAKRIVVAMQDPFPAVAGQGIRTLRDSSIQVDTGVLEGRAKELNAPYLKLLETGLPLVVAKWAMTLDGALATYRQDSKWISNELSRAAVHRIRSVMDAVIIGVGTAIADDPLLTTRLPSGSRPARVAARVIVDRSCRLSVESQLVKSVDAAPIIVVTSELADPTKVRALEAAGCEVLPIPAEVLPCSLAYVLVELGKRRFTNVLIEGGGTLLGHAFDANLVDEVHCFVSPKIVGGACAIRPVAGMGRSFMSEALHLDKIHVDRLADNIHIQGLVLRPGEETDQS